MLWNCSEIALKLLWNWINNFNLKNWNNYIIKINLHRLREKPIYTLDIAPLSVFFSILQSISFYNIIKFFKNNNKNLNWTQQCSVAHSTLFHERFCVISSIFFIAFASCSCSALHLMEKQKRKVSNFIVGLYECLVREH